jgi:hypothetical protein
MPAQDPRAAASCRSEGGYSRIEWLVIGAVILVIVAGAVVLGRMVASSMSAEPVESAPPSAAVPVCGENQWFDSVSRQCLARPQCSSDQTYDETTNTCAARAPKPTAIEPSSGLSTGGTEVRISGSGFEDGATVTIDGIPATAVQWVSGEAITAVTPGSQNQYPVDVVVTNPTGAQGTLDNGFLYVAPPVEHITEVIPPTGSKSGGEAVIIKGLDFVDGALVTFFGRPATDVEVLNDTTIRAITPIGPDGPVTVNVRNPGQDPFTLEDGFTYLDKAPRVVMLVRPAEGAVAGGTKITIAGTGFAPKASVAIGGKKAKKVKVISSTKITAVTPPGAEGPAAVAVRNPGLPAAILKDAFTYVPAPTVESVKPAKGPDAGGTKVTIVGTGFDPDAAVTIGGAPAVDVKVVNATTITATTPPGTVGPVAVAVENPKQPVGSLKDAFTYVPGPKPTPKPTPTPSPTPRPTPSPSPGPTLPRCRPLSLPAFTAPAGTDVTLDEAALFPADITSPQLLGASYTGDPGDGEGNTILWTASPPLVDWSVAAEPGRNGTLTYSYRSPSCSGTGTGTMAIGSS